MIPSLLSRFTYRLIRKNLPVDPAILRYDNGNLSTNYLKCGEQIYSSGFVYCSAVLIKPKHPLPDSISAFLHVEAISSNVADYNFAKALNNVAQSGLNDEVEVKLGTRSFLSGNNVYEYSLDNIKRIESKLTDLGVNSSAIDLNYLSNGSVIAGYCGNFTSVSLADAYFYNRYFNKDSSRDLKPNSIIGNRLQAVKASDYCNVVTLGSSAIFKKGQLSKLVASESSIPVLIKTELDQSYCLLHLSRSATKSSSEDIIKCAISELSLGLDFKSVKFSAHVVDNYYPSDADGRDHNNNYTSISNISTILIENNMRADKINILNRSSFEFSTIGDDFNNRLQDRVR